MIRRMLPEATWREIGAALETLDGDGAVFLRVARKSFPGLAMAFVNGGAA